MKQATFGMFALSALCIILRIWTGDNRYTGTGVVFALITIIFCLISIYQIGANHLNNNDKE